MDVTYFLKQFSLFSSLHIDVIRKYFGQAAPETVPAGETVIDYGDDVGQLYVIISGRVSVTVKDADGNDCVVDKLRSGATFGEMTILSEDAQPFAIKTIEATELIRLERDKLIELLHAHPKLHGSFYQVMVRRLHYMYSKKEEKRGADGRSRDLTEYKEKVLKRKEKELKFLDEIHHIIASDKPFKAKLSDITKGIAAFYDIEMCLLYLYEKDNRYVKLYAANDYKNDYASSYRLSQNDAIIRCVKEQKARLVIDDDESLNAFSGSIFLAGPDFKNFIFVPLIEDNEVVGLLALMSRHDTGYSDEDMRFLEIISGNFIGIVRKEQFDFEANLRTLELDTLKKIGEAVHSKASVKELLSYILESTASAMNARHCTLKVHDPDSGITKLESFFGFTDDEFTTVKKGLEKHLKGTVLNIGEYVIINDTSNIARFSDEAKVLCKSLISVPLSLHDKIIGMITVYDKNEDALIDVFDQNDLRLLTAIATHTSMMIENARLYDELMYSQSAAKVQLKVETEVIGKSYKSKILNKKIKNASLNADPVLILGEVGLGKNFVARCIHYTSNRMGYHFVVEDCKNFLDKEHGSDLFGSKAKKAGAEDVRGILEQSHDGTLALRHVSVLSAEVQDKLYEYLTTKTYKKVNGKRVRTSDVKIIFQSNVDIPKLVDNNEFSPKLYELISRQMIKLPPLRERKKDLPMIIEDFLQAINRKLQRNVTKLSDSAMGMLMSYDWPGNMMELYNVLERGVLVSSKDTIMSEQIILGLPRAEGEKTYNLLRISWVDRLLKSRLYPTVFQVLSALTFFVIIYFAFFSEKTGEQNLSVILSWIIAWPLIYVSYIFFGRLYCTVCPFSSISKFVQKIVNFGFKMPNVIKRNSNAIAVTFCFVILWFEEVTNIFVSPQTTGFLILFIFSLALMTSILYERMVWCRYLCPWGILNGLYAMTSVLELRSNRHICLTQCKTNVCYEGSEDVPGCPMYEHPFSMESNKNCTLCANCIKNCPNCSIQLNIRLAAKEIWIKVHPHTSDSLLGISLAFLFLLKLLLEIGTVSEALFMGYERYSFYGGAIYTVIFILTIFVSYILLKVINISTDRVFEDDTIRIRDNIGYAFIPLALTGYLSYFLEPLLVKGRSLLYAIKELIYGTPFPSEIVPILNQVTIKNIQVVLILMGGLASAYSAYRIVSEKIIKHYKDEFIFYKIPAIWVVAILTAVYLVLI